MKIEDFDKDELNTFLQSWCQKSYDGKITDSSQNNDKERKFYAIISTLCIGFGFVKV